MEFVAAGLRHSLEFNHDFSTHVSVCDTADLFGQGCRGRFGGGNRLKSARLEDRLVVLAVQFDVPAQRTHHLYKRAHLLLQFCNDLLAAIDSLGQERRDTVDLSFEVGQCDGQIREVRIPLSPV